MQTWPWRLLPSYHTSKPCSRSQLLEKSYRVLTTRCHCSSSMWLSLRLRVGAAIEEAKLLKDLWDTSDSTCLQSQMKTATSSWTPCGTQAAYSAWSSGQCRHTLWIQKEREQRVQLLSPMQTGTLNAHIYTLSEIVRLAQPHSTSFTHRALGGNSPG